MNYKEILDEIGVKLLFSPSHLDGGGFYIPNAYEFGENGVIIVDGFLESSEDIELVVLHECGHVIEGTMLTKLSCPQLHIINEVKANRFMIRNKAEDYLSEIDYQVTYFTPERFLNRFRLSVQEFYDIAEQEMKFIVAEHRMELT